MPGLVLGKNYSPLIYSPFWRLARPTPYRFLHTTAIRLQIGLIFPVRLPLKQRESSVCVSPVRGT